MGGLFGGPGGFSMGMPMQPPRKRARSATPQPAGPGRIRSGSEVWVCGLVKAAQHNGKIGTGRDFDQVKQRYTVQFDNGQQIALKSDNLVQCLTVTIAGVQSKP